MVRIYGGCVAHIDLSIFKALLQVVVDGVLGDRGQEGHVGDTSLLFLERILPVGLHGTIHFSHAALACLYASSWHAPLKLCG